MREKHYVPEKRLAIDITLLSKYYNIMSMPVVDLGEEQILLILFNPYLIKQHNYIEIHSPQALSPPKKNNNKKTTTEF